MWFLRYEYTVTANNDAADDENQIRNAPQFIDIHLTISGVQLALLAMATVSLLWLLRTMIKRENFHAFRYMYFDNILPTHRVNSTHFRWNIYFLEKFEVRTTLFSVWFLW